MNSPKVLLAALEERTSATGTRYLSGWLGKARIVGFLDREAEDGKTIWQIYAQEPQRQGEQVERPASNGQTGQRRHDNTRPWQDQTGPAHPGSR